jgi:cyclophilin family peptidyl-prolyl cis-trans isomerase
MFNTLRTDWDSTSMASHGSNGNGSRFFVLLCLFSLLPFMANALSHVNLSVSYTHTHTHASMHNYHKF